MEFTFHNSCVIIDIVPSAVIFWTELSYWPKGYTNTTTLLIGWSHGYKFYGLHYNQVDRYEISIYQNDNESFIFSVNVFFPLSFPRLIPDFTVYMSSTEGVFQEAGTVYLREYLSSPLFVFARFVLLISLVVLCCPIIYLLITVLWYPLRRPLKTMLSSSLSPFFVLFTLFVLACS
jgi:hypothetical protein